MTVGGIPVPANVYHYINPDYHKPYARWMPPFSLIKHVLTGEYTTEDLALPGNTNGFISYVTKKGVKRNGIHDFGIRSGCDYEIPDTALHGRIVATGGADSNVSGYERAYVQTETFAPLCREVALRLLLLAIVSSEETNIETVFNNCSPDVDIHDLITGYDSDHTDETPTVTFKQPNQNILDLMEAYKTALLTGQYQSPPSDRVRGTGEHIQAHVKDGETAPANYCSSDDEIEQNEARNGKCSIM